MTLTWQTAHETNNAGFAVERRPADAPGAWTEVGFVDGAGTTTEPQTAYRFRARQVGYGQHAFRLRQVDFDGTATRRTRSASRSRSTRPTPWPPTPTPATTQATVDVTAREAQT